MKDIKLNFSYLEEISDELYKYQFALGEISKSLNNLYNELSKQEGLAILSLLTSKVVIENDIKKYQEQCDEIKKAFDNYIEDMTGYITPVSWSTQVRVDDYDIGYNLRQMQGNMSAFNGGGTSSDSNNYLGYVSVDSITSEKYKNNGVKLTNIRRQIIDLTTSMADEYDEMNTIYKMLLSSEKGTT